MHCCSICLGAHQRSFVLSLFITYTIESLRPVQNLAEGPYEICSNFTTNDVYENMYAKNINSSKNVGVY